MVPRGYKDVSYTQIFNSNIKVSVPVHGAIAMSKTTAKDHFPSHPEEEFLPKFGKKHDRSHSNVPLVVDKKRDSFYHQGGTYATRFNV